MGDIFDDENEPTVTMKEYIEGVEAQELEADLVLGGDEGRECTYAQGYMKRQAVFSCLTCVPAGNAGVCTACSLACHDGHEVMELWTRRQFRCDCGNKKFGDIKCKLLADKDPENYKNSYNQNYKGLYCVCHRPYPDPEGEDQGEMIQCCICEDWFHENHLSLDSTELIPKDDEGEPIYEDFVCQDCAGRCSFLSLYQEISIPPSVRGGTSTNQDLAKTHMQEGIFSKDDCERRILEKYTDHTVDPQLPSLSNASPKENEQSKESALATNNGNVLHHLKHHASAVVETSLSSPEVGNIAAGSVEPLPSSSCITEVSSIEVANISKKAICSGAEGPNSEEIYGHLVMNSGLSLDQVVKGKDLDEESHCKLRNKQDIRIHTTEKKKPLFLASNWREVLCRCKSCSDLCTAVGVAFLLDKGDTLEEYENIAKQRREEKLQQQEGFEVAFLKNLGHTQQIELLSGINDMRDELRSFLESLDTTRPVTGADIRQVFDNLKRKRKRLT
uniref:TSA: Wollemia nobilis Ref_Wollemi_Transcript_16031_1783 transcribed RNA sequence n=1 Tax=Wollemia nobilis TaxID=56998 RepID=A0A0C9RRZ0_9CONI